MKTLTTPAKSGRDLRHERAKGLAARQTDNTPSGAGDWQVRVRLLAVLSRAVRAKDEGHETTCGITFSNSCYKTLQMADLTSSFT